MKIAPPPLAAQQTTRESLVPRLRSLALVLPRTEESVACKGTAVESASFKVGTKTFLFLRAADLRLKLRESLEEANRLAADNDAIEVGGHGWIKVTLGESAPQLLPTLEAWIEESYRGVVGDPAAARPKRKPKP
jgi:predicted DNA-binding protein (MmcQ/YjbR family)